MAPVSFWILSYFCCVFVIIISQASAQLTYCDNSKGNYTLDSTYYRNLNTLLFNFSFNTEINYGFYNFSYGEVPDKVHAIGLCKGDQKRDECLMCLNDGRVSLAQKCPNQKVAIVWGGKCTLRYSNRSIYGILQTQPTLQVVYLKNVTGSVEQFNEALESLMRNLTRIAASGDSRRKYASDIKPAPNFQTIFGNVQCTPDLSSQDCTKCLEEAISLIPGCCSGKAGGNILKPSCRIRFDPYSFDGPLEKLDPDSSQGIYGKSNTSRTIIAIIVPVASVVLVLTLLCIYLTRKPRKKFEFKREEDNYKDEIISAESLQFNFDTIRVATNEFADSNKLGQGGFGAVYRGQLSTGQEIAVKRLSRNSGQGDMEFKNEVLLVAKLQHRNLVRLLGYCLEGKERLLVYEFVPNKSLDYFIFDPTKKAELGWQRRQKIIGGTARGILYLHEDSRLRIIHRDLKASNILLDEEMHPKISDFGMARLICMDQIVGNTNRIVGTYGYMAPEYVMYGQFSAKSDVFSFGVLLLEIVSGQKINTGIRHGENVEHLLSFAWRNWREGTTINIVDPTLNDGSENEIKRYIHIGLLCVQENVVARPTMTSVVLMLNSYSFILPVPSEPAFVVDNTTRTRSFPNMPSSANKSTKNSINEASITELYPR